MYKQTLFAQQYNGRPAGSLQFPYWAWQKIANAIWPFWYIQLSSLQMMIYGMCNLPAIVSCFSHRMIAILRIYTFGMQAILGHR